MRFSLALLLGLVAVAISVPGPAAAQEAVDGRDVYLANCSACHQGAGTGIPGSFPPLLGNDRVQDGDYVRTVLAEGKSGELTVNGVTYNGQMPAFSQLSSDEVEAVIAYIQEGVFTPAETGGLEPGSVVRGADLFTGKHRLDNGGPACLACHTTRDYGSLGGSTLGPDLTDLAARYGGEEGVAAALANPPSATMQPVFDGKPIADQERADLAAYFASLSGKGGKGPIDWLLLGGSIGTVLLFGVMWLVRPRIGFARQLRSTR
jgi:mono/diheme cytochrome c family protein